MSENHAYLKLPSISSGHLNRDQFQPHYRSEVKSQDGGVTSAFHGVLTSKNGGATTAFHLNVDCMLVIIILL